MQNKTKNNAIITVVRDPAHNLGKRFDLNPDGTISKKSTVCLSFGIAVQHHVPSHDELAALLNVVGSDPSAAIINASFKGIEIGEEFAILSEREIENRLGFPASDRERQKGVHQIDYNGKQIKAVGRFKENVCASIWQLLDRDIDAHTPQEYQALTTVEWIAKLANIIPGIDQVSYVTTPSTSSRVMHDGKPVGAGNGHVWIKVVNPDDIERVRTALIVRAAEAKMTWLKPRYSKSEKGTVVGNSLTTILDPSVWTPGRLVFDGQPTVGAGLTIVPMAAVVHSDELDVLDTTAITLPDAKVIREVTREAGIEMSVKTNGSGLTLSANNLTLETEIETKEYGNLTVRKMIERGFTGKIRCHTPFRDSTSWAAFYNTNNDGIPYIYDSGTSMTHWLNEFEADEVKIIPANAVVKELIPKVSKDSAAVLEEDAIKALASIKHHNPAAYDRWRNELKSTNAKVSLTNMDRAVKVCAAELASSQTHHGYAKTVLAELTVDDNVPVGHQGALYAVNPNTNLWEHKMVDSLIHWVANTHDGKEHCSRSADYRAIAEHAISLANDDSFFAAAPNGLACPGGFYQVHGDAITTVQLTPDHRQYVMLDITPAKIPTLQFDEFLHQTFKSDHEGEEQQQITLLQEIAGGIMLGTLHKQQIAVMFYEPFGRAGKGTLERLLRSLVPKEFVTAISPFKWNQDYHIASLAGKRLNVVGELPESEAIPAAAFKTVLGGDLVTGRHPTHRPITFTNEAAHLFTSNHLITTKDQSEAFYARWRIIEFPNSRLRTGLPLDPNLAQRIINNELPGIAFWALEGAARLIKNGKFSASSAHDRLMAKWRRSSNTLEEFIHECCTLGNGNGYRRSTFYIDYTNWSTENNRRPFSKGRVKELLEHNIGMGIRLVELNGHETFSGIKPKPEQSSSQSGLLASNDRLTPEPTEAVTSQDDFDHANSESAF